MLKRPAAASGPAAGDTAELDYFFGWDPDMLLGWRQLSAGGRPEFSLPPSAAGNDDDMLEISWSDGLKWKCTDCTVGMFKQVATRRGQQMTGGEGNLWTGYHAASKNEVSIAQRVDRKLLMSVYLQTRQVLQVRMSIFGKIEDESAQVASDHPACVGALAFLTPIAVRFAAGEIAAAQLYPTRDAELVSLGLKGEKKRRRRRRRSRVWRGVSGLDLALLRILLMLLL